MMSWLSSTVKLTDSHLHIVLAVYGRDQTDVPFLGGENSILGALQFLKSLQA
jgi:hypothetical protein